MLATVAAALAHPAAADPGPTASAVADVAPGDPATPATRDALFARTLKAPRDIALTLAYAKVCAELQDYEGAIGALERVMFYAPGDARIEAELGFLYYQLHSNQMARQHFDSALAAPGLDADTRAKIAAIGAPVDEAVKGTRLFGVLQTGVRYQSNAAFNPDNNILRLSGQDYVFTHPQNRGADGNVFGIAQIGYDYDLGNQRGDTIEARATGYGTRQFRFPELGVGLYDLSLGPRLALAPDRLPGWTIKPYIAGGQVFLAGQRYLASGGAGIVADLPIGTRYILQPGLEVRRAQFANVSVFSSLNTGDTATVSLAGEARINDTFGVLGRVFYTRDYANAAYQTSSNYAEEIALVARLPAPFARITLPWSVSPYVKLLQTRFDGANPFIDASTTRRDNEVQAGVVLDTPINDRLGIVTNVQYAHVGSNIPNFRLHNVTVLIGPTVRF